jgi:hypothetical protein
VILPVVLCDFEYWSVTLTEEHVLNVSENMVFRRILKPEKEIASDWRNLRNDVLHNLYSSITDTSIVSRSTKRMRHVVGIGEVRNVYKVLIGQ